MSNKPVDRKVYAATIGSGAGVTVSAFALWIVDAIWWPAEDVDIPDPVAGFASLVVTVGLTLLAGWFAKAGVHYTEEEEELAENPEVFAGD